MFGRTNRGQAGTDRVLFAYVKGEERRNTIDQWMVVRHKLLVPYRNSCLLAFIPYSFSATCGPGSSDHQLLYRVWNLAERLLGFLFVLFLYLSQSSSNNISKDKLTARSTLVSNRVPQSCKWEVSRLPNVWTANFSELNWDVLSYLNTKGCFHRDYSVPPAYWVAILKWLDAISWSCYLPWTINKLVTISAVGMASAKRCLVKRALNHSCEE